MRHHPAGPCISDLNAWQFFDLHATNYDLFDIFVTPADNASVKDLDLEQTILLKSFWILLSAMCFPAWKIPLTERELLLALLGLNWLENVSSLDAFPRERVFLPFASGPTPTACW